MRRPLVASLLCLMSVACARSVFAAFDFADGETGSRIVEKDATKTVFRIQLFGDEAWTATTDVPTSTGGWIKLLRVQGTDGSTPLAYQVLHNYSTDARTGHIYINNLIYTVTQLGYGATLSPSGNVSIPAAGTIAEGQISFSIVPATDGDREIAWTASSDSEWVTVRPSRGDGDSTVYYSVDENVAESERVATLTIAGQQILLTQSGAEIVDPDANKVWLVPETSITCPCPAKEFDISLVTGNDVNWIAASDAEWIVITTSKTGTGSSVMHVSVPENRSVLSRSGKITVNNAELTVIQRGKTDFELALNPQASSFSYGGAISNVSVAASQDMSWTAKSSMPWVRITSGGFGAGSGNVRYVVSANPTLQERTAEIEVEAWIPYPEIDIARGLTQWKNENWIKWTVFNDPSVRDADVQGCTEGVWFRVNETNALNRLFDLNNGAASLYVQEFQNRLVYDAPDGSIIDLGFSVATNVTYDLFLVTTPTTTAIYGGIHDSGVYRHLYTDSRSLRITNYKHTTKPSEDWLVKGDASTQAYYFWNRPLTAIELLNFPSEAPRIPAVAGDVYLTLYSHTPMDRFRERKADGSEEILSVSNVILTAGREGLNHGAFSGDEIHKPRSLKLIHYYEHYSYNYGQWYGLFEKYDSDFVHILSDKVTGINKINSFGGSNRNLKLGISSVHAIYNKMSCNLWLKTDGVPNKALPILSFLRTTNRETIRGRNETLDVCFFDSVNFQSAYKFQVSSNGFSFVENSVKSADFGGDKLKQGKWHMLTLTSNGSKMTMYLDGEDIGTMALAGGYDYFCLDSWCAYGNGGKIVFDDIKTFTSCLTTDQINEIYNREKPLKRTLEITQGIAMATLSETKIECSSKSTSKTVSLNLPAPNIAWTAEPHVGWITPSLASGTGPAEITLTIDKNPETSDRTGVIVIGGIPVTIHQRRAGITVPYNVIFVDFYQGNGDLSVPIYADDDDTHWVVEQYPLDQIIVLDENGYGSADLHLSVMEMDPTRSLWAQVGTVTVSGKKFYVVQRDYVPEIEPHAVTSRWNTVGGSIQVTTGYGIEYWEAVSDSDWITIAEGCDSGVGSGAVTYTLAENDTGKDRVGRIIIAGEVCFITQRCTPVLTGFEIVGDDSMFASDTVNYLAQLLYSDGTSVPAESVSWNVSDSAVAEVDAQGSVTAWNSAGSVVVSASCMVNGKEWTADREIEIKAKPVSLEIEVSQDLICPGWTVEVVFTVTYVDGATKRVLPTAFVEGDATLDEDGFLTIGATSGEVRVYARYSENGSGLLGTDETIYVREPISVNEALGDNSLIYISVGDASWQVDPWRAHDQTFSMKAGMVQANQTSDLMTEVDGVGTLSFWARTSTAESASDASFQLIVDGLLVVELSGQTDWTNIVHEITTYDFHDIVWRYKKGAFFGRENEDAVWIDQVHWTPGPPDPLPRIESDADVEAAIEGSADDNLAANLTNMTEYNAYRAWVDRRGFDHQTVKDAPKSWLSYALDSSVLINKRFRKGDLSIDIFAPYTAGGFLFELGLNGVGIGDNATAANLGKVFGIEGASMLDGNNFSSENVTFSFGMPNDGKATIVAEPKDGNTESFFLRATMRDFYDDVPVVSLSLNGGGSLNGASDEILVDRDAAYGALPTPTRTGYTFDGWYTKAEGGTKVTGSTTITANSSHALYAHWTPNTYTITFDPNGGNCSTESKIVTYGATYGDMPKSTRLGYSFKGWFTKSRGGIEILGTDRFASLSNVTVYAQWAPVLVVTFDAKGGSASVLSKEVVFGQVYGELPIPQKTDYVFVGWFSEGGSEIFESSIVNMDVNHVVYAHWIRCEYSLVDGGALITKYQDKGVGEIYVPRSVDGYKVVGVGGLSFYGRGDVHSLFFPDGVCDIGDYAFADCVNLTNLVFCNSITNIGSYAFSGCSSLSSPLILPKNVVKIGDGAFLECNSLTSVILGGSELDIGDSAFSQCSNLSNVIMHEGVKRIGDRAFCLNVSLAGPLSIPRSVTHIGDQAFATCCELSGELKLPNSVTNIGENAFYGCAFSGSLILPNSVEIIGERAFGRCGGITNAVMPSEICAIPEGLFEDCYGLRSITMPETVTNIGAWAFYDCSALSNIAIPHNVITIDKWAFCGCEGLFEVTMPVGILRIGEGCFGHCRIENIVIPCTVKDIGAGVFTECVRLRDARIPLALKGVIDESQIFVRCSSQLVITYY